MRMRRRTICVACRPSLSQPSACRRSRGQKIADTRGGVSKYFTLPVMPNFILDK